MGGNARSNRRRPERHRVADAAEDRPSDLVVISPRSDFTCAGCGDEHGGGLVIEAAGPLCLAALTRRARRASGLSAVVVRFSRSRKRYERQGVLVEEAAPARAEEQCLADEEVRAAHRSPRQRSGADDPPPADRSTTAR